MSLPLKPKTVPAPAPSSFPPTYLGDVATSFAETARAYDEFLAPIISCTNAEKKSLTFTSASDITKMHTFSTALRTQLKEIHDVLEAHSSAAKTATWIEVISPNADTILSTDEFPVDASGAATFRVKDVTKKLREKVTAWRDEKRAEIFQELLDAYEQEWFPPVRQVVEPQQVGGSNGSVDAVYREILVCRDRVRMADPHRFAFGRQREGILTIQWKGEKDSHIHKPPAKGARAVGDRISGCIDIKFHHEMESGPFRGPMVSVSTKLLGAGGGGCSSSFVADAAQVSEKGKLQLVRHTGSTQYADFEFLEGGVERAKEACMKIKALESCSRFGLFAKISKNIDDGYLNALSDGKAAKLIEKFEAKCATEHPFLSQFARWWSIYAENQIRGLPIRIRGPRPTPIKRVEAVPFAGDDDDCVDPKLVQNKSLLDLAKDASIAEFGGGSDDGCIVLRFHAIVAEVDPRTL